MKCLRIQRVKVLYKNDYSDIRGWMMNSDKITVELSLTQLKILTSAMELYKDQSELYEVCVEDMEEYNVYMHKVTELWYLLDAVLIEMEKEVKE